jgi:hypothetical protein
MITLVGIFMRRGFRKRWNFGDLVVNKNLLRVVNYDCMLDYERLRRRGGQKPESVPKLVGL